MPSSDLLAGNVLAVQYRAAPHLELVPLEGLAPHERKSLAKLCHDGRVAGFLRARSGAGRLRAVDRDTARLFQALQAPGPLPADISQVEGADAASIVARLVLDGVVEVCPRSAFVSGPHAVPFLFPDPPRAAGTDRLHRLSRAALAFGAELISRDPLQLAWRLYRYHTEPASPEWRRRLPDDAAVETFLGLDRFGALANRIEDEGATRGPEHQAWHHWRVGDTAGVGDDAPTYKLYCSPLIEHVTRCLASVVESLGDAVRPFALKVGRNAYGLLRPDKMVLYFDSHDRLATYAEHLASALSDVPAHGVPFTASLIESGLLSWGVDPPASEQLVEWHNDGSWRGWVVNRLAVALLTGREAESPPVSPVDFAVARIALDGVDPDTWAPHDWRDPECSVAAGR